jgi:hypothetical protein
MNEKEPSKCSPAYLLDHVASFRSRHGNLRQLDELERLATDERMGQFWDWLASATFTHLDTLRNATTVARAIARYTRKPGKPGNLSRKRRAEYFERVRKCALELETLLSGTRFDRAGWGFGQKDLSETDCERPLESFFEDRGIGNIDGPDCGVVAFYGTMSGTRELLDHNFPESHLTDTLRRAYDWTFWDDWWDDNFFLSSAPIIQSETERSMVSYFTCMLHDWLKGYGVDIPFPVLATVANVALRLPPDAQADEDTVRKQVRRYQQRMGGKTWLAALDEKEKSGQN